MPWFKWSQTANSNASADASINWAEGMPPSAVNDSSRAMMAASAMYRDDIAGAIVTGGTANAYTVASFSVFDSLADMNGQQIWFTPHATNTAGSPSVMLNVDGLGQKPLRTAPNTELLAGVLIQGTPYGATYNNSDGAWYLKGFFGNPFNMPLAGGMDFWGTTVPNSSFAFPIGQAISRTTYATLFAIMGTTYGSGDGSTTFNLPDKTGRVSAMKEAVATRLTSTGFGGNSANMGAVSTAADSKTLAAGNIPSLTSSGTASPGGGTTALAGITSGSISDFPANISGAGAINIPQNTSATSWTGVSPSFSASVTYTNASPTAMSIVQPTIICNYIIRII